MYIIYPVHIINTADIIQVETLNFESTSSWKGNLFTNNVISATVMNSDVVFCLVFVCLVENIKFEIYARIPFVHSNCFVFLRYEVCSGTRKLQSRELCKNVKIKVWEFLAFKLCP